MEFPVRTLLLFLTCQLVSLQRINILLDSTVDEIYLNMTTTRVATILENNNITSHIHIASQHVQVNAFVLTQDKGKNLPEQKTIGVINCFDCKSFGRTYSSRANLAVWCIDVTRRDFLATCDCRLTENVLWNRLLTSLDLHEAVLFYDKSTVNSLDTTIDALPSSYSAYWSDESVDVTMETIQQHNGKIKPSTVINTEHHNFIITTTVDHATDIISKSQDIRLLGPEFNWLVDLRHDVTGDGQMALSSLMQDGDNTAIVTRSRKYITLQIQKLENSLLTLISHPVNVSKPEGRQPALLVRKKTTPTNSLGGLSTISLAYTDGYINNPLAIFPREFLGFHGRIFRVVVKTYEPFIKHEVAPNGTSVYSGMCIELLDSLAASLNFRYELFEVVDGKFGVLNETNQWNGLIGTIARKEADLAAAGLTISAGREEVVDFTFPYWEEPSTVLLKKPNDESKMRSLFRPFKVSTWLAVVASVFASSILIFAMCLISRHIVGTPETLVNYPECLWYSYGALLGQGVDKQPVSISSRIVASCWWLVVIVIYAVYTGNLVAFLTVNIPVMPFNSLLGMTQQDNYYYGLEDGIVHMMLFKEAESGVYRDIWRGISSRYKSAVVPTTARGLEKVAKEQYAFIGEKTFLEVQSADNCDLVMIEEEFFKSGFGFAVQEGWPFKKYIDEVIMSMVESGFIEHWKRKHWSASKCGDLKTVVQLQPTDLDGISGEFVVFLCGGILATVALFAEMLLGKRRSRKSRRGEMTSSCSVTASTSCFCRLDCCRGHGYIAERDPGMTHYAGAVHHANNSESAGFSRTRPSADNRAAFQVKVEEHEALDKTDSFKLSIKNFHLGRVDKDKLDVVSLSDEPKVLQRKVKNTDNINSNGVNCYI